MYSQIESKIDKYPYKSYELLICYFCSHIKRINKRLVSTSNAQAIDKYS